MIIIIITALLAPLQQQQLSELQLRHKHLAPMLHISIAEPVHSACMVAATVAVLPGLALQGVHGK
jgi:hypothetical protein